MSVLYSIDWKRIPLDKSDPLLQQQQQQQRWRRRSVGSRSTVRESDDGNGFVVQATCLNGSGEVVRVLKRYEDWFGVCTDRIGSVVREIEYHLPGARVRFDRLDPRSLHRPVLPYFLERLKSNAWGSDGRPFYRVYVKDCPAEHVAVLLGERHDVDYFLESDWNVRLYVDLCTKHDTRFGFYYRWYRVDHDEPSLLDALEMLPDDFERRPPPFTLAAFDIETVAGADAPAGRVPDGSDPEDRIVMISLVTWKSDDEYRRADQGETTTTNRETVLFLNPLSRAFLGEKKRSCKKTIPSLLPLPGVENDPRGRSRYEEFDDENDLLTRFHVLLEDVRVLTGYNVDLFDVPCIYSRLLFLGRFDLLRLYSSRRVGERTVASFDDKIVLDLYGYFKTFSNYDLIGFKLDDVARVKLGEDGGKLDLDSVGIHAWFNDLVSAATASLRSSPDAADDDDDDDDDEEDEKQQRQQTTTEAPSITVLKEAALGLCRSTSASDCHALFFERTRRRRRRRGGGGNVGGETTRQRRRRRVPPERFGTFPSYLEYCLRDSLVVRDLFLKENVFCFLTERARLAAVDVVQALHFGNSRFLLRVFQSYGTLLGFFVNANRFGNRSDHREYSHLLDGTTAEGGRGRRRGSSKARYQGALNYCVPERRFEDVSIVDFSSMYPTVILCSNLCYGTCDIMTCADYSRLVDSVPKHVGEQLRTIPYRTHSDAFDEDDDDDDDDDVRNATQRPKRKRRPDEPREDTYRILRADGTSYGFLYPRSDAEKDSHVIVHRDPTAASEGGGEPLGFLPTFVQHFLRLRGNEKRLFKETGRIVHFNSQLCIKLLLNSLYGVMASKDSPLAYIAVAVSVVTLARYQLLGTFRFVRDVLNHTVCYADTDSLMIHRWPLDDCDALNRFLRHSLPHVEIELEGRLEEILVLSKKRYVYKTRDGTIAAKGFSKRTNGIVRYMLDRFNKSVMGEGTEGERRGSGGGGDPSDGWTLWVDTLQQAHLMSRLRPWKYAVTRKTRRLKDYKSTSCPAVKFLKKHPEKQGEYVDFTFGRADVCAEEEADWITTAEECRDVNFEKLFLNERKSLCGLLNAAYWKAPHHLEACVAVLNAFRWKYFLHAELVRYVTTGKKLEILTEKGLNYPFEINDHPSPYGKRQEWNTG